MPKPDPTRSPGSADTLPASERALARARAAAAAVVDPELPFLTIEELGILRGVRRAETGIVVELTPTYLGCPATLAIRLAVEAALVAAGFSEARVEMRLAPAWSTAEITAEGRRKLAAAGIAPPAAAAGAAPLFSDPRVACPRCGSERTHKLAEFGATACKAQWRCEACAEPFDYFKCI